MIEAREIDVVLGGRAVLSGVSLALARGEIVGIIGPPEAGKSVLLKTLAGLVPLAAGRLLHDGVPLGGDLRGWRRRIGMSFQNDALFDSLSLSDNVAFPLRRRRVAESEVAARVARRLEEVGLGAAGGKLPREVSGGMRKRAGIARATVIDPELGLFDDPVAGLDPVTGGRILDLVVDMTARLGMATAIISNDLPVLLPSCTRVVMLSAGGIVYEGDAAGLLRSPRPEVVQFATGADEGPL